MRIILALILSVAMLLPEVVYAQVTGAIPTFADCSIASMSGSSQALGTAYTLGSHSYGRKYLLICNTGAANDNVGVNLAGGTAALSGAGTLTVVPGACLEFSSFTGAGSPPPPSNNINVIGTSTQPVVCLEGK